LPIGIEMAVGAFALDAGWLILSLLVQGRRRVEIVEFTRTRPFMKVRRPRHLRADHG